MGLDPKLSRACFIRDGWKCRHCNDRGGLHPHHVVYKSHGGEDALYNLITLCAQCHRAHHDGFLVIKYEDWLTVPQNKVRFVRMKGWKPS